MTKNYVKVLGIYESLDGMYTEVVAEAHKDDLISASEYIINRSLDNVTWILKPCIHST